MDRGLLASIVLASLAATSSAFASDGAIEINQTSALAGGVNGSLATDPPGFPVVITSPGKYQLSGNLKTAIGQSAITILSNDVTIDLNGFTVDGSWRGVEPCGGTAAGVGISDPLGNFEGISVMNGKVRGFLVHGVVLGGEASRIENVVAERNCVSGLWVGVAGSVIHCQAMRNQTGHGVIVHQGGTVSGTIAAYNGIHGILGNGLGVIVSDSSAVGNGNTGIWRVGGLVSRSTATANVVGIHGEGLNVEVVTSGNSQLGINDGSQAWSFASDPSASFMLSCGILNGVVRCPIWDDPPGP